MILAFNMRMITSVMNTKMIVKSRLEGMFVKSHGKDIFSSASNSEYYGEKYFLDGWWMPVHRGWFFKAEFLDTLTNLGAMYVTKSGKSLSKSCHQSHQSHQSLRIQVKSVFTKVSC